MKIKSSIAHLIKPVTALNAVSAGLVSLICPAFADTVLRNREWTITIGNEAN